MKAKLLETFDGEALEKDMALFMKYEKPKIIHFVAMSRNAHSFVTLIFYE